MAIPPDEGTATVLRNGSAILLDRDGQLGRLQRIVRGSTWLRVTPDEGRLSTFGLVVLRGPAPVVVNSKEGRGPAAVLGGGRNSGLRS